MPRQYTLSLSHLTASNWSLADTINRFAFTHGGAGYGDGDWIDRGDPQAANPVLQLANLILMMHYFRRILLLSRINGDAPPASEV